MLLYMSAGRFGFLLNPGASLCLDSLLWLPSSCLVLEVVSCNDGGLCMVVVFY